MENVREYIATLYTDNPFTAWELTDKVMERFPDLTRNKASGKVRTSLIVDEKFHIVEKLDYEVYSLIKHRKVSLWRKC